MGRGATKAAGNVWYEARIAAAKWNQRLNSREGAAEELGVAERLTNAEYYDHLEDDELMNMLETDLCEYCEEKGSVIGACEGRWCDAALAKWKEDLVK